MPKVTWHGKGGDPLPSIEVRGVTFPLGEAVDVEDHELLDLLASNPHFEVENGPDDDPESGAPAPAEAGDDDAPPRRAAPRRHHARRKKR